MSTWRDRTELLLVASLVVTVIGTPFAVVVVLIAAILANT